MLKSKQALAAIGFSALLGMASGALLFHLFGAEDPKNLVGILTAAAGLIAAVGAFYSFRSLRRSDSD